MDKDLQLDGLIDLKNSFNKRKKNQKNESQTETNKTIENWLNDKIKRKKLRQKCQGQN